MLVLWLVSHVALIACRVFKLLDVSGRSLLNMAAYSFLATILVFAVLFLTPSLVKTISHLVRARAGRVIGYVIGLGTLTASIIFTYPVGFSAAARVAFVAFAVVVCGMLCAGKQVAG